MYNKDGGTNVENNIVVVSIMLPVVVSYVTAFGGLNVNSIVVLIIFACNFSLALSVAMIYGEICRESEKSVSVPIIGVDRINDVYFVQDLVNSKRVDMIFFGRASIAKSYLPS